MLSLVVFVHCIRHYSTGIYSKSFYPPSWKDAMTHINKMRLTLSVLIEEASLSSLEVRVEVDHYSEH